MSFMRGAFVLTFTMLVLGFLAGLFALGPLFHSGGVEQFVPVLKRSFSFAPPPSPSAARAMSQLAPTATPRPPTATARPRSTAIPSVTPAPTLGPTVVPTPSAIRVALQGYSLDETWVRPGQQVAVRYVITNTSGRTVNVLLGASLKPARSATWSSAVSDSSHDVVASVPPGTTAHLRYFTVPYNLHPGIYDAAWGLKNASTGASEALVTSRAAIRVTP